jgi:hypothetical protein
MFAATLTLFSATAPAADGIDTTADCAERIIGLSAIAPPDRTLICRAAGQVQQFFGRLGIDPGAAIRVQLAEQPPDQELRHIGRYTFLDRQITLLSYASTRQHVAPDMLFGSPMDEALYTSVVVHELAHAIADQHFRQRPAPRVVQEYIAYAAQLSTIDPALREAILGRFNRRGFSDICDMSTTYYGLDPSGFGTCVFRHFRQLENPGVFVRKLLDGEIYCDSWDNGL